jgi:hypothetical protein
VRRADHSSRAVILSVVCVTDCGREASTMRKLSPRRSFAPVGGKTSLPNHSKSLIPSELPRRYLIVFNSVTF